MEPGIIGGKIAKARKECNMSQAQLAQRLFISPQAVGKWERGESIPDILTFNRLAEILGVDLNYFSDSFPSVVPAEVLPAEKAPDKPGWNMSRGNWVKADFSGLKDLHEKFSGSNMQSSKFVGSDMSGLLMKGNSIDSCDFTGADLSRSRLEGSSLQTNIFTDCLLKGTEFSRCHIRNCNFMGANFSGAVFRSCSLEKNTFTNALLHRTSFNATYIADVVFEGIVEDCSFEDSSFANVIFRNTKLTNTFFKGRNLKKIRFVDCEADRLTYEFLKNGKANLTGIILLTA
ncbi:MAG: pentapeptide repeat-containing protein [Chitinophaga sp.]|uniref:pentapeptide repeat-containing protein n=1 Tax=Chitinophaga sp. TaxID=1869181 RepID=UPI001B1CDAD7|nr:pentapeptide repeat-containing protein [Chitinophaga sp.]MBO9728670.1 pentapeptide repeat-containing protein [Chitinophaga sp.]